MSGATALTPLVSPHCFREPNSPFSTTPVSIMSLRKRKADEDLADDRGSPSSSPAPASSSRLLAQPATRHSKRARTNATARQLALPRLLETLSPDDLRGVLRSICERHPQIGTEIVNTAPKPSALSALSVLNGYEGRLRNAFPYGDRPSSDYAYNRVRQSLLDLLDALRDYTPNFLPPNETQPAVSLTFLHGATDIIEKLPEWDSYQCNRHKQDAYEDISQAWILVIREAAKKGGGIQIQYGGWDQKLAKHNELSGGRLQDPFNELRTSLGWIGGSMTGFGSEEATADPNSIRQQLLNGTYGANAIQVGPW